MISLIIYKSIHHRNTEKIAKIMSGALEADLLDLKDVSAEIIDEYDLIGFGSGVYYKKPHKKLLEFIDSLDYMENKEAFIFSTGGGAKAENFNGFLKGKLSEKGFKIIDEFHCKGLSTFGPLKIVGGINKGRPDDEDFKNAKIFAVDLKEKIK